MSVIGTMIRVTSMGESNLINGMIIRLQDYTFFIRYANLCIIISNVTNLTIIENSENVVIVHCNHGKGRTGTAIMAYLLSISDYQVSEVLKYYNKKRFLKESYVVDQPCQIRYLNFFKEIVNNPSKESYRKQKAFQLK